MALSELFVEESIKFITSKIRSSIEHSSNIVVVSDTITVTTDAIDRLFTNEENDTNSFCIEVVNRSDKDILWTIESGYVHYEGNALKILRNDVKLKAQMKSVVKVETEIDFEYECLSSDKNECVLYIKSLKQPVVLKVKDVRTTDTDNRRFSKTSLHDCYETVYYIENQDKNELYKIIESAFKDESRVSIQQIIVSDVVKGYSQYYQADVYLKVQVNENMMAWDMNNLLFSKQNSCGIQTCGIQIER